MVSVIEWYLESRTEHVPFQNKANDGAMVAGYTDDVVRWLPSHEQRLDSKLGSKQSAVLLRPGAKQGEVTMRRG